MTSPFNESTPEQAVAEHRAWELQCYGCTEEQARKGIDSMLQLTYCHNVEGEPYEVTRLRAAVASLLSNVQEMIHNGRPEDARQALNVAKLALFEPPYLTSQPSGFMKATFAGK